MKTRRRYFCYNSAMRRGVVLILAASLLVACGCAAATPEPAAEYVAKNLWFDEVRPVSVRVQTVRLPDPERKTAWWTFLPGILYGTWSGDAGEDFLPGYRSIFFPTFNSTPVTFDENESDSGKIRSVVAAAFRTSISACLGCAGIFESTGTANDADADLELEFTVFRRNTRYYTYGLTPLVAAVTFWIAGCPFRGVWYEFEVKARLADRTGETLWQGRASGKSRIFLGACWTGHGPECSAFHDAYIQLLTDLFGKLSNGLPSPDDPAWEELRSARDK